VAFGQETERMTKRRQRQTPEQSMQNLVDDALTVAVTEDGPQKTSRFTMRYKE